MWEGIHCQKVAEQSQRPELPQPNMGLSVGHHAVYSASENPRPQAVEEGALEGIRRPRS